MNLVEQAKIKDPKIRSCIIALLQQADQREIEIKALIAKYKNYKRVTGQSKKDFGYFVAELELLLNG